MDKKIKIFSHNYLYNNWKQIMSEQLTKLIQSGLYLAASEIYYCVYAENDEDYSEFIKMVSNLNKISIIRHSINDNEFPTMIFLDEKIKSDKEESYVLYYHLKGITSKYYHKSEDVNEVAVESWRKLLEYFNIEKWETCLEMLNLYDMTGAMYIGDSGQYYHHYFSGNFWWTNSEYIRRLPKIKSIKELNKETPIKSDDWWTERMICELWIGMIPHSFCTLYSIPILNIYNTYFDESEYKNT